MRKRPVAAKAGDGAADKARVTPPQFGHWKAQPLQAAGLEILDEHIGLGQHRGQQRPVGFGCKIQADGLLAAIEPDKIGALALGKTVIAAGKITFGPLDLDHPRTGIGQPRRGEGRCHRLFDGDDQQSCQRPAHRCRARSVASKRDCSLPTMLMPSSTPMPGLASIMSAWQATATCTQVRAERSVSAQVPPL